MTPEEVIAKVKARAKANFKTGMNCAECVFEAVLSQIDTGLPHEIMCVMTGFGGGGGLFGDTCGALVGAMAALGAVYGRRAGAHRCQGGHGGTLWHPRPLPPVQPPAQRIQAALRQHPVPPVNLPVAQNLALQGPPPVLPQPGHRERRAGRGDGGAQGPGPLGLIAFRAFSILNLGLTRRFL